MGLGGAGQIEEAERVARTITNPLSQPGVLADVAAALFEAAESNKDVARAVHLIAVILTGTAWLEGLPALSTLAPGAVKGIRKALQQERS